MMVEPLANAPYRREYERREALVRSESCGLHAWTLLHKAREARREASRATSHQEAEFHLFASREYVAMARRANHQSIRARETPRRWTPPVLRELEAA